MELSPDHRLKGDALGIDTYTRNYTLEWECWIYNMPHTYFQLFYHLVWSTKNRVLSIPPLFEERLHGYIGGAFKTKGCLPIAIGGMPDHVHVWIAIPPTYVISEVVRNIKVATTKWVRETNPHCFDFAWQEGYGAFSVSVSNKNAVINYIKNQKEHHKGRSFKDEFLILLKQHEIEHDEKYLWKWHSWFSNTLIRECIVIIII